jgi:hypothetical protein
MLNIFSPNHLTVFVGTDSRTPLPSAVIRIVDKTTNRVVNSGGTLANGQLLFPLQSLPNLNNLRIFASKNGFSETSVDVNPNARPQVYFLTVKPAAAPSGNVQTNQTGGGIIPVDVLTGGGGGQVGAPPATGFTAKPKFSLNNVKTGIFLAGVGVLAIGIIYFTRNKK